MIAGLIDQNAELFTDPGSGQNHIIINSQCLSYVDTPDVVIKAIDNSITPDHREALKRMGKLNIDEQRQKWWQCNSGSLDSTPDYVLGGNKIKREYIKCPVRSGCKEKGVLCLSLSEYTGLTERHITILELIAEGKLDKEIADILNIKTNTVKSHNKTIRTRLNLFRKTDLVGYAKNIGLI